MKHLLTALFFGKDARFSGLIALGIVGSIALGCNCNKSFGDLGTTNESNTTTTSNTTTSNSNTTAPPQKADASTGQVPTDAQAQELARTTVLDFNRAIQSGDFTDFHKTLSKPFQKQASVAKLEDAFKEFVEQKIDFSEIRTMPAYVGPAPSVETISGVKHLLLKGAYSTSGRPTRFDLKYIPEGKDWKLISIEINTKDEY